MSRTSLHQTCCPVRPEVRTGSVLWIVGGVDGVVVYSSAFVMMI